MVQSRRSLWLAVSLGYTASLTLLGLGLSGADDPKKCIFLGVFGLFTTTIMLARGLNASES